MNVTREDIIPYGFVMTALFDKAYPTGTTVEQLEIDALENGWIRAILPAVRARREVQTFVDVSEVGM